MHLPVPGRSGEGESVVSRIDAMNEGADDRMVDDDQEELSSVRLQEAGKIPYCPASSAAATLLSTTANRPYFHKRKRSGEVVVEGQQQKDQVASFPSSSSSSGLLHHHHPLHHQKQQKVSPDDSPRRHHEQQQSQQQAPHHADTPHTQPEEEQERKEDGEEDSTLANHVQRQDADHVIHDDHLARMRDEWQRLQPPASDHSHHQSRYNHHHRDLPPPTSDRYTSAWWHPQGNRAGFAGDGSRPPPVFASSFFAFRYGCHFNAVNLVMETLATYKEYMWIFYPLPPAVFDESNVRYYLGEGREDLCSLSLCIHTAICLGSGLKGNAKLAYELEGTAVQQLGMLCADLNYRRDFPIAMASMALSGYCLDQKLNPTESRNHLQRTISICKEVNAVNSLVYSLCLWAMASRVTPTARNMEKLEEELYTAKEAPYYPITVPGCDQEHVPSPLMIKLGSGFIRFGAHMVGGIRMYRENLRRKIYSYQKTPGTESILQGLWEAIRSWEQELSFAIRYLDGGRHRFPKMAAKFAHLLTLTMWVEYHRISGEYEKALGYAMKVLRATQSYGTEYLYVLAGGPHFVELVLNFFWETKNLDCLGEQLEVLEDWGHHVPLLHHIRADYKAKLRAAMNMRDYHTAHNNNNSHNNHNNNHNNNTWSHQHQEPRKQPFNWKIPTEDGDDEDDDEEEEQEEEEEEEGEECNNEATEGETRTGPLPSFWMFGENIFRNSNTFGPQKNDSRDPNPNPNPSSPSSSRSSSPSSSSRPSSPSSPSSSTTSTRKKKEQLFIYEEEEEEVTGMCTNDASSSDETEESGTEGEEWESGSEVVVVSRWPGERTCLSRTDADYLHVAAECMRYQSAYRKYLFHFAPLHPLVLDEANVYYYITTDETSSLSLAFYVCLSAGAMTCGNMSWAQEFFKRADCVLERLLIAKPSALSRDYSIALSLVAMVFLLDCLELSLALQNKKDHYLSTVRRVCTEIRTINSDAFVRYLYFRAIGKGHSLMEAKTMKEMMKTVTQLDCFSIVDAKKESFVFFNDRCNNNDDNNNDSNDMMMVMKEQEDEGKGKGKEKEVRKEREWEKKREEERERMMEVEVERKGEEDHDNQKMLSKQGFFTRVNELQQLMPISLKNLSALTSVFGIGGTALLGLNLDGQHFQDSSGEVLEHIQILELAVKEFLESQADDPWPSSMKHFALLLVASMYERYHFRLGNGEAALHYAHKIVEISEKEKCKHLYFGMTPLLEVNVHILYHCRQRQLLERQVVAMEKWAQTLPSMQTLQAEYMGKLQLMV